MSLLQETRNRPTSPEQPLANQMEQLKELYQKDEVPVRDYVDWGLQLIAETLDRLDKKPSNSQLHQDLLEETLNSRESHAAFAMGRMGGTQYHDLGKDFLQDRIAQCIDTHFSSESGLLTTDYLFTLVGLFRKHGDMLGRNDAKANRIMALVNDLNEGFGSAQEHKNALVLLDMMTEEAFRKMRSIVDPHLSYEKLQSLSTIDNDWSSFWLKKVQTIQFARGYVAHVAPIVMHRSQDLYPEDKALDARMTWRGVAYMNPDKYRKQFGKNVFLNRFRVPVFKALGENRTEEAVALLNEVLHTSPDIFNIRTQKYFLSDQFSSKPNS